MVFRIIQILFLNWNTKICVYFSLIYVDLELYISICFIDLGEGILQK